MWGDTTLRVWGRERKKKWSNEKLGEFTYFSVSLRNLGVTWFLNYNLPLLRWMIWPIFSWSHKHQSLCGTFRIAQKRGACMSFYQYLYHNQFTQAIPRTAIGGILTQTRGNGHSFSSVCPTRVRVTWAYLLPIIWSTLKTKRSLQRGDQYA